MNMDTRTHHVKCWPRFYKAIDNGTKPFEVRFDDRNYRVGDILIIQEYDPESNYFSGNEVSREITYKVNGRAFGIQEGFCVLGLKAIE